MIRSFTSAVAGIIAGLCAIFMGLMLSTSMFPYPSDLDTGNMHEMSTFFKSLPDQAFYIKAIIHIIAAFSAGMVASLVSEKHKIQTGVFAAFSIFILILYRDFRFEYPTVYVVVDLSISAIAAFIGVLIGARGDGS